MSYSREEVKAITDKILNMVSADAAEVDFSGGERAATRFANSTITANLIEHDQQVAITAYYGRKSATVSTHQFDDASLKAAVAQAQELAKRRPENPEMMPLVKPPQDYVVVEAALPTAVSFGPAERAQMVRKSIDICEKKGVLGAGYIPKMHWTDATANTEGLFAYNRYAEASFILDVPHARRRGIRLVGHDRHEGRVADRRGHADRGGGRQGPQVAEAQGARARQLHGHPRAAAGGAVPVADARRAERARRRRGPQLHEWRPNAAAPGSGRRSLATTSRSGARSGTPSFARRRSGPTGSRRAASPGSRRVS